MKIPTNHPLPPDHQQRLDALDPKHSFIVQAPAGSGKTELLTQRFLTLLANVHLPEHILAITFTRKAAREMTERIKHALCQAQLGNIPSSSHGQYTFSLAKAALTNDTKQGWGILQNPHRLKVMTIDAFCMQITQQLPVHSGLSSLNAISNNPHDDYQLASQNMLTMLEEDGPIQAHLMTLLGHLDHQESLLIKLFCQLLACRDQWLPMVLQEAIQPPELLKQHLEETLLILHESVFTRAEKLIPQKLKQSFFGLCQFAGLQIQDKTHPIAACRDLTDFPDAHVDAHTLWLGIANCLLTQDSQWRKSLNKRCGFPCSSEDKAEKAYWKEQKDAMLALIASLKNVPGLLAVLQHIRVLPPPQIDGDSWSVLQALLKVLPLLAAQCQLVFSQRNHVDYIEIAASALSALTHENSATQDIALALHNQLHHLLVDEFQDTSPPQFGLIEALVAHWSLHDNRSLFLVGDPMQSIYRFRQADVGLFMQAKQHGIGTVHLRSLTLTCNFRSHAQIIDWINQTVGPCFPDQYLPDACAIPYVPSVAFHPPSNEAKIDTLAICSESDSSEETWLINTLKQLRQQHPDDSIALLVRARSHLPLLLQSLANHQLPYQAIELSSLAEHPLAQDLTSLTLALTFPNHMTAWMSLLRSPCCGLSLQSLLQLKQTLPESGFDKIMALEKLDHVDDQSNFDRFKKTMQHLLTWHHGQGMAESVARGALALGFNAFYPNDARIFDRFIETLDKLPPLQHPNELTQALNRQTISMEKPAHIQILTIHKSKGLEFDHVLIPFAHKPPPPASQPLLRWQSLTTEKRLIMSPISNKNAPTTPLYRYLQQQELLKEQQERIRLFYVACTRAKKTLKISCQESDKSYHPNSFAALIEAAFVPLDLSPDVKLSTTVQFYRQRLDSHWQPHIDIETLMHYQAMHADLLNDTEHYEQRLKGICLHQALQRLGEIPPSKWQLSWVEAQLPHWRRMLQQHGSDQLDTTCSSLQTILLQTLEDPRAQWIFQPHSQAQSEWPVNTLERGNITPCVIDRTFISNGVRWIIDFKTTFVSPESLANQQQYLIAQHQEQLHRYARALQSLGPEPIRCGLYFPDGQCWLAWDFDEATSALSS